VEKKWGKEGLRRKSENWEEKKEKAMLHRSGWQTRKDPAKD